VDRTWQWKPVEECCWKGRHSLFGHFDWDAAIDFLSQDATGSSESGKIIMWRISSAVIVIVIENHNRIGGREMPIHVMG